MKKIISIIILSAVTLSIYSQGIGFGLHTEAGYAFNLPRNNNTSFNYHGLNIAVTPGYHMTQNIFVGAGIGFYDYKHKLSILAGTADVNLKSIPVYAYGLYSFPINAGVKPFVSLKAGYGFISEKLDYTMTNPSAEWQMKASGGLYLSPALGVLYPINAKHSITLGISYDLQQYQLKKIVEEYGEDSKETNSAISLKLGWFF